MPRYIQLEEAAKRLGSSPEQLRQFEELGWITTVEKAGVSYLADHQEYRANFILALKRRRKLESDQIAMVLDRQRPPFNMNDVDRILSRA